MKKIIIDGLVYDIEKSTILAKMESKKYGESILYKTEKGNFFYSCFSSFNAKDGKKNVIEYDTVEKQNIEELIQEWDEMDDDGIEKTKVFYENFEQA